jgi:hypothetical protein
MRLLTPKRQSALLALVRGPLDRTPEGWVSRYGVDGCWTTFVILELKRLGFCSVSSGRKAAGILPKGREYAQRLEDIAA